MTGWFSGSYSYMREQPEVEFEGLELIHTNSCVDMSHLFENIKVKNDLSKISNWNTSRVVDMNHMFALCDAGDLDLSL